MQRRLVSKHLKVKEVSNVGKTKVALVVVSIVFLAVVGLAWWRFYIGIPVVGPAPAIGSPEKLAVNVTSYSANSITLEVVCVKAAKGSQNITLTAAIVKNLAGSSRWAINLANTPVISADQHPVTVYVDLIAPLPIQQQFTVTLTTAAGSLFDSPAFTT